MDATETEGNAMYSTIKVTRKGTRYPGPNFTHRDDAEGYAVHKMDTAPETRARVEVFDAWGTLALLVTRERLIDLDFNRSADLQEQMYRMDYPSLSELV